MFKQYARIKSKALEDQSLAREPSAGDIAPPPAAPRRTLSDGQLAFILLAPAVGLMIAVVVYPVLYAIWLSMHQESLFTPGLTRWSGVENYVDLIQNPRIRASFVNTFKIAAISVPLSVITGLAMALAVNAVTRGRGVLRAVVLIPWAILTVVVATSWKLAFDPVLGFVNDVLTFLRLPGADIVFLTEPAAAYLVVVVADVWRAAPFVALLMLAGLQVIPEHIDEAAAMDGATGWQRLRDMTLPLLKPVLLLVLILRTLDALAMFDIPFVMTGGAVGTSTIALTAQQILVAERQTGPGSAMAVMVFVLIMAVSLIYIRIVGGNIRELSSSDEAR